MMKAILDIWHQKSHTMNMVYQQLKEVKSFRIGDKFSSPLRSWILFFVSIGKFITVFDKDANLTVLMLRPKAWKHIYQCSINEAEKLYTHNIKLIQRIYEGINIVACCFSRQKKLESMAEKTERKKKKAMMMYPFRPLQPPLRMSSPCRPSSLPAN